MNSHIFTNKNGNILIYRLPLSLLMSVARICQEQEKNEKR